MAKGQKDNLSEAEKRKADRKEAEKQAQKEREKQRKALGDLIEDQAEEDDGEEEASEQHSSRKTHSIKKASRDGLDASVTDLPFEDMDASDLMDAKAKWGMDLFKVPSFAASWKACAAQRQALKKAAVSQPVVAPAYSRLRPGFKQCASCKSRITAGMLESGDQKNLDATRFTTGNLPGKGGQKKWAVVPCSNCLTEILDRISQWCNAMAKALSTTTDMAEKYSYIQVLGRVPARLCAKTFKAEDYLASIRHKVQTVGYERIGDSLGLRITLTDNLDNSFISSVTTKQHFIVREGKWILATGITGALDGLTKYPLDKLIKGGLNSATGHTPYECVEHLAELLGQDFIPDVVFQAKSSKAKEFSEIDFADL